MKASAQPPAGRVWRPEAPDLFSDRHDDATEDARILREFERAHDEALSAGRCN